MAGFCCGVVCWRVQIAVLIDLWCNDQAVGRYYPHNHCEVRIDDGVIVVVSLVRRRESVGGMGAESGTFSIGLISLKRTDKCCISVSRKYSGEDGCRLGAGDWVIAWRQWDVEGWMFLNVVDIAVGEEDCC